MLLVTGGAYQGKTDYVSGLLCMPIENILDGETCELEDVFTAPAIRHFEAFVKRFLETGNPRDIAREICERNPSIVIITTEIGCGIIPEDKKERRWREEVGRACCVLANFADTVIRVNCGIPFAVKGTIL